jgi:hypothetical protein
LVTLDLSRRRNWAKNGKARRDDEVIPGVAAFRQRFMRRAYDVLGWNVKLERGIPMRRRPITRLPNPKAGTRSPVETWHNGGDIDQYARSLQKAAQNVIQQLNLEPNPTTEWDACPVLLLYREAIELRLKVLVGESGNFLPSPTDHITLYKTHSIRWLAQIIRQIIKRVGWENEFKCEDVSSLADFSALVNDLEEMNPVPGAVRSSSRRRDRSVPHQPHPPNVFTFATKLDALLELLDSTADALAAEWDIRQEAMAGGEFDGGDGFGPTI